MTERWVRRLPHLDLVARSSVRVELTGRLRKKRQGVSTSRREQELERHVVAWHHSFRLSLIESLTPAEYLRRDWHHKRPTELAALPSDVRKRSALPGDIF